MKQSEISIIQGNIITEYYFPDLFNEDEGYRVTEKEFLELINNDRFKNKIYREYSNPDINRVNFYYIDDIDHTKTLVGYKIKRRIKRQSEMY